LILSDTTKQDGNNESAEEKTEKKKAFLSLPTM
jgi:hypothetical protein